MNNTTMMYIVIGLLSIFFIVLLIFSVKTWRVLHLISVLLVFLAAGFFVWVSAATLQTQDAWRGTANKLNAKIKAADKQIQLLREGDDKAEDLLDSVREAEAALAHVLLDRPSVWRGGEPEVNGNSVRLTIPPQLAAAAVPPADAADPDAADEPPADAPPADGADPAAPAARHSLDENMIVYAFLEGASELSGDLQGFMVPQLYLGEYKVTAKDDTSVTLTPTIELTALQQASQDAGAWTIYDNMPTDSGYAFAGQSEEDMKILFPQERMGLATAEYDKRIKTLYQFFSGLDPANFPGANIPASEAALARLVPIDSVRMDDAAYQAFIATYTRDGVDSYDPKDDPPESEWVRVQFTAPLTSIQVDDTLQDINAPETESNFDDNAATVVRRESGEIVIGQQSLIPSKPGDETLGQLPLSISILDHLKLKSDWEISELWDEAVTPPKLKQINNNELKADELDAVREAKSVTFEEGEIVLFDKQTADFITGFKKTDVDPDTGEEVETHLIAEEAKVVDPDTDKVVVDPDTGKPKIDTVYVRPLHDYKSYFRDNNQQELLFQDNALVLLRDTVTLVEAGKRAKEQETFRSVEIGKLRADRVGFEREVAAITGVLAKVEAHRAQLNARLSQLYNNNIALADKIFKLQYEQAANIERSEAAPASSAAVSAP